VKPPIFIGKNNPFYCIFNLLMFDRIRYAAVFDYYYAPMMYDFSMRMSRRSLIKAIVFDRKTDYYVEGIE